jgi:hypothetical protein
MSGCSDFLVIDTKQKTKCRLHIADIFCQNTSARQAVCVWCNIVACLHYNWCHGTVMVFLLYCWCLYINIECCQRNAWESLLCWSEYWCQHYKKLSTCYGNATLGAICILIELQNILPHCQQYTCTYIFKSGAWYFCLILTKFWFSWQFLMKVSSAKLHKKSVQ